MSKHLRRAMRMIDEAKTASGFRPETQEEWTRLQRAREEMAYAMYREAGMSDKQARRLARQIHSGTAGSLFAGDVVRWRRR